MNPDKMKDDRKVFYWNDTGAVECTISNDKIVQAVMVEAVVTVDEADVIESQLPMMWSADE